jgi:hypothetical protein
MKELLHSKSTLIVVAIVIILGVVYFYYNGTQSSSSAGLVTSSADQSIGSAELSLLSQIQSLKIDPSLFQDPVWNQLQDYTRAVPTEPVGRPNPFEPYDGEDASSSSAGSASSASH